MTIKEWQEKVYEWCERKGWNENLVLGNMIANLHSEISEAWEEIRNGHHNDAVYDLETKDISLAIALDPIKYLTKGLKPEGFPIEMADLVIRVFHLCEWAGFDLEEMIKLKMEYNETRPYRHGGKTA